MTIGICNDLNVQPPASWTLEEGAGPYELADHCISQKTNLHLLLDAWLKSGDKDDEEYDWLNINYWAARLRPLWAQDEQEGDRESISCSEETIVVVCNRFGEENGMLIIFLFHSF